MHLKVANDQQRKTMFYRARAGLALQAAITP